MSDATAQPTAQPGDDHARFVEADPAQPVERMRRKVFAFGQGASTAYHSRFVAVYVALALVVGIGAGALVISLLKSDPEPAAPVATAFTPSRAGELGAVELAEDVQRKYRRQNGQELVGVVASRNTLQDGNLGLIRVRYQYIQPADSGADGDSKIVAPDSAIQYSLCGTSVACGIPGAASPTRFALLRRQGLELAIRTFQNDSSVDNVAVFLRPVEPSAGWEGYALVFDRAVLNRTSRVSSPTRWARRYPARRRRSPRQRSRRPDHPHREAHAAIPLPVPLPASRRTRRVDAVAAGEGLSRSTPLDCAARRRGSTVSAGGLPRCGSTEFESGRHHGSSGCRGYGGSTATRSIGSSSSVTQGRPTTSSRTSCATCGRCSIALSGCL